MLLLFFCSLLCTVTTLHTTSGWGRCMTWPIISFSNSPTEPGTLCLCLCMCVIKCWGLQPYWSLFISACWPNLCAWSGECQLVSVPLLRCRCSMSVEDGAKLYDVCPHVSDSVRNHKLLSVTSGSPAGAMPAVSQGSDPYATSSCPDRWPTCHPLSWPLSNYSQINILGFSLKFLCFVSSCDSRVCLRKSVVKWTII